MQPEPTLMLRSSFEGTDAKVHAQETIHPAVGDLMVIVEVIQDSFDALAPSTSRAKNPVKNSKYLLGSQQDPTKK